MVAPKIFGVNLKKGLYCLLNLAPKRKTAPSTLKPIWDFIQSSTQLADSLPAAAASCFPSLALRELLLPPSQANTLPASLVSAPAKTRARPSVATNGEAGFVH